MPSRPLPRPEPIPEPPGALDRGGDLAPLEVEVIDLFVNAVKLLGIPKSVGEIYGLLYASPDPLPIDVLVERLRISKGSASQGLRFLRNLGAVRAVYVAGSRRDHFAAETELKRLAAGFIKGEFQPHIENGELRLARLADLAEETGTGEDGKFYRERIGKLRNWHRQASKLLPLVLKFLSRGYNA